MTNTETTMSLLFREDALQGPTIIFITVNPCRGNISSSMRPIKTETTMFTGDAEPALHGSINMMISTAATMRLFISAVPLLWTNGPVNLQLKNHLM